MKQSAAVDKLIARFKEIYDIDKSPELIRTCWEK